jgi:hypothetical protein
VPLLRPVRGARRGMIASKLATLRHGTNQFEEKEESQICHSTKQKKDDRFEEKMDARIRASTTQSNA